MTYHVACCRIRSLAKLTSMPNRTLASWKCDDCKQDSSSQSSAKSDLDDPKLADILLSIQKEIAASKTANKEGFSTLEQKLSNMQSSFDTLRDKLTAVEAENLILKEECVELRTKSDTLSRRLGEAELQLEDMKQYSRNRNVEIKGIPVTKNENAYTILEAVANALELPFDRQSISIAHRLPAPRGKPYGPSIIAQFLSRSTRADWISAARVKKLQTTDLVPSLRPAAIMIVEHLTPFNKQLLGRARSHVNDGFLAYAWCRDGRIMVRKSAEAAAKRVRSFEDIDMIANPGVVNDEVSATPSASPHQVVTK